LLFVHIGTHKTGTSALQTFFRMYRDSLEAKGVHYLNAGIGQGRAHHALAWSIRGMHGRGMGVWDEVRDELAASRAPIDVISSEALWFTDPARVRDELKDVKDLRIVVYLRRQDRYLQSLYKQAVTSGRKNDFASWRTQMGDRGDFLSVMRRWADAFGRQNMIVRAYERDGARIDVTDDFFEVLGVSIAEEAADRAARPQRRFNPSPRRELLALIRAANMTPYEFEHDKFFWSVIRHKAKYVGSGDLLPYEECVALMRGYEEANRVLAEEFFGGAALFPPMARGELPPAWGIEDEDYVAMAAHLMEKLIDMALAGELTLKPAAARKREKKKAAAPADEED
jgi:hypothetical protein